MARYRRRYSATGLYHIVMKGIDKKWLFHDEQDKLVFIKKLFWAQEAGRYAVIAYCLMDNHIHLVLREGEQLGKSIQRFSVSYVAYYHRKYGTSGHFFNNRFYSDPIEEEKYLLSAVRYVHQNPVRANMVENCIDYRWSSYREINGGYSGYGSSLNCELIYGLLKSQSVFETFHLSTDQWFAEDNMKRNVQRLDEYFDSMGVKLSDLSIVQRNKLLRKFAEELNISGAELAEYFDLCRKTVYRVLS